MKCAVSITVVRYERYGLDKMLCIDGLYGCRDVAGSRVRHGMIIERWFDADVDLQVCVLRWDFEENGVLCFRQNRLHGMATRTERESTMYVR